MIHIILLILKIIGWLLLILIGLVLFLLGVILLSPIRYRFSMEYDEALEGNMKVSWLCHILTLTAICKENRVDYQVRLFGITLFPKVKKEVKKQVPETVAHLSSTEEEEKKEERSETNETATKEIQTDEQKDIVIESSFNDEIQQKEPIEEADEKVAQEDLDKDVPIKEVEKNAVQSLKEQEDKKENCQEEKLPVIIEEKRRKKEKKHRRKRKTFFQKIKERWYLIKQRFIKLKKFIQSIPKRIRRVGKRWDRVREKINYYRAFYKDEVTQRAIKVTKTTLKKLCLHTLPRKFKGTIVFGTEDPALTGQILGILSMGMPLYKDKLKICPVFDEPMLAFDVKGKGRIQLGYYVYLGLKFWFHQDVKQVIARIKTEFKKVQ